MEELHTKLWIISSGVCRRIIKPIRSSSCIRRLKIKEKRSFATSETAHPLLKTHIPEVRTFQPHCHESIKTFVLPFPLNTVFHYVRIAERYEDTHCCVKCFFLTEKGYLGAECSYRFLLLTFPVPRLSFYATNGISIPFSSQTPAILSSFFIHKYLKVYEPLLWRPTWTFRRRR